MNPSESETTAGIPRYDREVLAAEKDIVERALLECKYNRTATAKILGVDRKTLYNIIKRTGIELSVKVEPVV